MKLLRPTETGGGGQMAEFHMRLLRPTEFAYSGKPRE